MYVNHMKCENNDLLLFFELNHIITFGMFNVQY